MAAAGADCWLPLAAVVCGAPAESPLREGLTVGDPVAVALSARGSDRFVESADAVAGRRLALFGKNSGGTMMTIAVRSNARKKRLSIELMGPEP